MIQQGVNQLLSTMAVLGRLGPGYEQRTRSYEMSKKAGAAEGALKDIESNLYRADKEYTGTELSDIKARVSEHNRDIYNFKTEKLTNPYAARKNVKLSDQPTYSKMLSNIEKGIAAREEAMERMRTIGMNSLNQDKNFSDLKDQITKTEKGGI